MSDELPPIRCVTCNKVLGAKWTDYEKMISNGVSIEEALNKLELTRPCCRLRIRNPFKVVQRPIKSDISKAYEENFDTLSMSFDTDVVSTGALSAMTNVTSMVITPEEDEISLPPLPDLSSFTKKDTTKVTRVYQAW